MRAICCATVEWNSRVLSRCGVIRGKVCTFFLSSFLSPITERSIFVCIWGSSYLRFHCANCGMAFLLAFLRVLVMVGWGGLEKGTNAFESSLGFGTSNI